MLLFWYEKLSFLEILILKCKFGDKVPGKHFVGLRKIDDSVSFKIDERNEFGLVSRDDNLPEKKASLLPFCKKFMSIFSLPEIKIAFYF